MPSSPFLARFLQLNNEHFTRRSAQIRLRRQHIPASFSELNQLIVRQPAKSFTKIFKIELAGTNTLHGGPFWQRKGY